MLKYIEIKKAKEGSKEAFIKIIDKNLDSMYRVAKGILSNEEDIEDAIQETIINAYKKISTLREVRYFKSWLIRILINECNKIYNRNKKYVLEEITIESVVYDKENDFELEESINMLNEDLRVTTRLYYFEDMSIKEIAKILDIAEGTVKSRLARAREKLYELLKGCEV